ncbi:MAG: alpha-glucuronidase family glycosyl hydrolase [Cyclobacteriaceae bacterium]|nr:alpha-glucuronidase family glycosyl hydrolase [Cyclobacteriaceae bacterium]
MKKSKTPFYMYLLRIFVVTLLLFPAINQTVAHAEDGYELWMRYPRMEDKTKLTALHKVLDNICIPEQNKTYQVVREELRLAASGMLGITPTFSGTVSKHTGLVIGTPADNAMINSESIKQRLASLGIDGYLIDFHNQQLVVAANTPVGALYGTYHLLRILQINPDIAPLLPIIERPKITHRILNHWDNLDRTVERGYAGFSIWDWHKLPDYIDQRYIDYARANASIGINGTVLTNVNANALVLTPDYLKKVVALADVFRPYGIKVYLTARFSAPVEIGKLPTADPLDEKVKEWWQAKAKEIYEWIPDFGGFVVKANSEGQPGPQNYNRSHADGANMLADAVAPFGGIVMWRAFVYSHEVPDDRAKQANNEFEPLDGQFRDNVFIQVKNGAIDFQPREPFHPLFGKMPNTSLALEFQITQEYLGQATNLAYLAPLYKECLDSETHLPNAQSTVASIIDGSAYEKKESAIAGVANIGNDRNWTGHLFGQSNWYAYGRLAWNHSLTSRQIADEWISLTFGIDPELKKTVGEMMLSSRETVVNYMTPLGLHHIMGRDHHYGPGPWVSGGRPDWTSLYYHKADSAGIGFDRTATGSNAIAQYQPDVAREFSTLSTCPEEYLLWFHHLPWDYTMRSGKSLWDELCIKYDSGVKSVREMRKSWHSLKEKVDPGRYRHVEMLLNIQEKEAAWWRNSCLLYFRQFSGKPFPSQIEQPQGSLEYYESLQFPYAPGIKPTW